MFTLIHVRVLHKKVDKSGRCVKSIDYTEKWMQMKHTDKC